MSAPRAEVDVAVVGAGIVGLAAAEALARRGAGVVCLDGGAPGHAQSAGRARGFRHLHAEPALMGLAVRSRAAWRALETRAGVELLERGGMLRLGGEHEPDIATLRAAGIDARVIDAAEAAERFPVLAPEAGPLLFDPDAGAVRAADAIRALTGLLGDRVVRAQVHGLDRAAGGGVRVRTAAGELRCRRCLVCAGAGTERLVAPLGIAIERERRAALRLTFPVASPPDGPMPVWGDRSGRFGERAYGTPEGADRYAVGLVATTEPLAAAGAEAMPAGAVEVGDVRRRLVAYVRAAFPGLHPEPVDAVLRMITPFPGDEDRFGLWIRDGVLAFAGHNLFKHAPALGELLAGAALGDEPDPVLAPPAEL
jgi:sarcosine oxidase